jgi:hypothetical protein
VQVAVKVTTNFSRQRSMSMVSFSEVIILIVGEFDWLGLSTLYTLTSVRAAVTETLAADPTSDLRIINRRWVESIGRTAIGRLIRSPLAASQHNV